MTDAELDLLGQRLGVTLPAAYRAALRDDAPPPSASGSDYAINDVGRLLTLNHHWREHGTWTYLADDARESTEQPHDRSPKPWPPAWLVIGEGLEGDVYFIDTARQGTPVFCRLPEGACELWMPTLSDLAASLRADRDAAGHSQQPPRRRGLFRAAPGELPPGVTVDEAAHYLFRNYPQFTTAEEQRRYEESAHAVPGGPAADVLSDDPELRAVQQAKNVEFRARVVDRVLSEHGAEVLFNRCPRCGALCRTPRDKQCFRCGHAWR